MATTFTTDLTAGKIAEAIQGATPTANAMTGRFMGSCRVYVTVSDYLSIDEVIKMSLKEQRAYTRSWSKKMLPMFEAATKQLGMIFQAKGYGVTNAIKVGYWNGSEDTCNEKAEGICQALRGLGISAHVEYVGD